MGYVINMRILPINFNNPRVQKSNFFVSRPVIQTAPTLKADTVSFKRVAENAEQMRKLFKYGMIDIHTGQPLIDPEFLKKSLQTNLFDSSIQAIVKALKPLENCLHPVEAAIFKHIEEFSVKNPLYRLDETIHKFAPHAQVELLSIQRPIFERLKRQTNMLPSIQKSAFMELMDKTEHQLENRPIYYKFSKKEFNYKLQRIGQGIKQRGISHEVKSFEKLTNMAQRIPYIPSGRNFKRRKVGFDPNKSTNQAAIIRMMDNYFLRSSLKHDKELKDLFANAKMQVFNIPSVVPFTRKTFLHELKSITDTLDDTKLARKIMKIASELPTAQEEVSAFIMKSSRNSSEKIGYDLLIGSVGTIDHLEPYSAGGADALENYAFTSTVMNSRRGNKKLSKWMKDNPLTYLGAQKSADRLLELYRNGVLEKEKFNPWYICNFARRMRKLSPEDAPLDINIGNLQQELISFKKL